MPVVMQNRSLNRFFIHVSFMVGKEKKHIFAYHVQMTSMYQYSKTEAIRRMNGLSEAGREFIFIIDYEQQRAYVEEACKVDSRECLFDFGGIGNAESHSSGRAGDVTWKIYPPSFDEYSSSFNTVRNHIMAGNSYLVNLTFRVAVETNLTTREIFTVSNAPYRLWMKDRFVCFSPETFVRIGSDGRMSSYPMKGTIDATLPDAHNRLMSDMKEAAEHATVVDLIRNDLSMVADRVNVARYRYCERIATNKGAILQTSSEITGMLPAGYPSHIGDIIFSQLPAGSITGAPKQKTCGIISEAETYRRGFYTGVMGRCDGRSLDSAVMIRFVEQDADGRLFYKAGGGITSKSDAESEYKELIQKIYVPFC